MTIWHTAGAVLMLAFITYVGLRSGRRVKSAGDFNGSGHEAGAGIVAGIIIGTLVGGASTIGTAQLAFSYGFSAWWFTLGGGLGCLVLAFVYAKPMIESGAVTLPQILSAEYGKKTALAAAVMTSVGSFLSLVSQLLSGMALITSVSGLGLGWAVLLAASLMLVYVVFGGAWGVGSVGVVKTVVLCLGIGLCGVTAVCCAGGLGAFSAALPKERYFHLFARGIPTDLGAGLSLVVGVITTQTYIQAIISAKNLRIARKGAILSAALIPLIGVAGVYVGLYMRLAYPDIQPASALPLFILEKMPPPLAGILLAALLVALVGTGAGLCLGISAMLCRDIYRPLIRPDADDRAQLRFSRAAIVAILLAACALSLGDMGSMILSWSFLSMGLRGAVAFFPLTAALFCRGRIPGGFVRVAMVAAPLATVAARWLIRGVDPLFPGMAVSLLILAAGALVSRGRTRLENAPDEERSK